MNPDTRQLETSPAPPVSDGEPDAAAAPTLIVFGDDDESICVDDTCVPVGAGR